MRIAAVTCLLFISLSALSQSSMEGMNMPADIPHADGKKIYHLYITDTTVNYTGKSTSAIAVNGTIPAPTLEFTEGDTAVIFIHNMMMMETSVHWHGLIIPNKYDGVSYLTTPPIGPMQTYVAEFPIVQNGTYWYHSHTMLQEQSGLYGAFIIHKKPSPAKKSVKEYTVLLSDWINEKPYQVQRSLHNATDWYAIGKKSTQDYWQALKSGHLGTKLTNEWKRMLAMDVSDVYYDRFLINGKTLDRQPDLNPGDTVRLRLINGSSSTYFWLGYGGGPLTVIANDGKNVEPVAVDRMIIATAETYDVLVTIPQKAGSYEFRATSEDRTRAVSLMLGKGDSMPAPVLGRLNYFEGMKMMNGMMDINGNMNDMGMRMSNQAMDMNSVMYPEISGPNPSPGITTLNYGMLRSPEKTTLPAGTEKILRFNLTGNMNRYVWTIDNKKVSETDKILIHHGENVKIILYNGTMMRHPMHLHGHFFRVLNGQGDYAPLKNTLDIMPMETDTLEFAATEGGDWFFHCHILYHMMSGMGRIFSYTDSLPDPALGDRAKALKKVYADDREIFPMAKLGLESNGSDGEIVLANTRYRFQTEWRIGTDSKKGYESESHIGRYLGKMQFWFPYVGWDFRYRKNRGAEKNLFGQIDTKDKRTVFCAGVQYTLPMLLIADARVDMKGNVRVSLGREDIPLSSRLRLNFMTNTDKEYIVGLRWVVSKYFGISSHYDSDMGWGAGITFNY
jgi:FtsP/CotA-like multicopper oxidase with cupredoxin domain